MSKITVAYIGVGGIGKAHLTTVQKMRNTDIVGLCDINKTTLAERQAEFGGETFTKPAAMLDAVRPDCVFVCLPPFAHGEAECACAERGIPFLVEKPIGMDMKSVRRIAKRINAGGSFACAGYMNRYRKGVQRAKKLLRKHPVSLAYGGWLGGTPRNHPWLTQKKLSGGQFFEQTTHVLDLLRYTCGDATQAFAFAAKGFVPTSRLYSTDDASSVALKMKNGMVANIMSSWSAGSGGGISLTLLGPDIQVAFSGWGFDVEITVKGKEPERYAGEKDIFDIQDRAFIAAVRKNDPSALLARYDDGMKTLAMSVAAEQSLRTREMVRVK